MTVPAGSDSVVIVGASLAGATAAATLRSVGFEGDITLIGAEPELPYERPALSKEYLLGQADRESLLVRPPEFYDAERITVRLGDPATGLNAEARTVALASGDRVPYGRLIIATGADNIRPPIPGMDLTGVFQLRTRLDADELRAAVVQGRTAVVVGMGFIGCEIASTLTRLGLSVTALDALPGPLWEQLGPTLSGMVRGWHEANGVRLRTGQGVTRIVGDTVVEAVEIGPGERVAADLVVVGVGVRPATGWLADAPLHLAGGVGVDASGRTNLMDVYAAGDVAAAWDERSRAHRRTEHWSNAIDQGRRVAHAIVELPPEPPETPYFWSRQYDKYLQYAGSAGTGCERVTRGGLDRDPLTVFLTARGVLVAVLTVNNGREFRRAQRLIGRHVDPAALADPAVDLRQLVSSSPLSAAH